MCFEIKDRDLLGRVGRLETKSGVIETPALLPVVNPAIQLVKPERIKAIGYEALITNAYIIKRRFGDEAAKLGIHRLLNFNGVIMTDSGAYQILVYGRVKTTPEEIVYYQEDIETDIATILDIPTGWRNRKHAERTVRETIKRAKQLWSIKRKNDILWVGPIQGGRYTDLVRYSAKEISKLPYHIHALGSPTEVMERYLFPTLVDMIMAAKMNIPPNRPFHLFGAGHPVVFSLAVALGCDLFDSAAYAIYARDNRYMTAQRTIKLNRLEYLPCSCPVCKSRSVEDLKEASPQEREKLIAEHNLYVCLSEVKTIKQAIVEGRLWEHLECRMHSHPSLINALKRIRRYVNYLERHTPISKKAGALFFTNLSLIRPEVYRHKARLIGRFSPPRESKILLLIPQTNEKPVHRSNEYKKLARNLNQKLREKINTVHICVYGIPFGLIPIELDATYPLSQFEASEPDEETLNYAASIVYAYIISKRYEIVILLRVRNEDLGFLVALACDKACRKLGIPFFDMEVDDIWIEETFIALLRKIEEFFKAQS